MKTVNSYLDAAGRYVNHMGMWEWFFVTLVVVVIGMMCMKGFGSRSNY